MEKETKLKNCETSRSPQKRRKNEHLCKEQKGTKKVF